jgi:hypothetical protein
LIVEKRTIARKKLKKAALMIRPFSESVRLKGAGEVLLLTSSSGFSRSV